ncbi:uncharacterized protein [Dermacentor albipictus]|uniref:uncharacterized protein n=1 Tax=Dermacentor albipictus TaxID=60249 RepID=UPI0031FC4863
MDSMTWCAVVCVGLLLRMVHADDDRMRNQHNFAFWTIRMPIIVSVFMVLTFLLTCGICGYFWYRRRQCMLDTLQPSPCMTAPCAPITSGAMNHSQPEVRALLPDAITHSALPNPQQLPEHHPEVGFNINNKGIPLSQPSAAPMPSAPLESPPPYGN